MTPLRGLKIAIDLAATVARRRGHPGNFLRVLRPLVALVGIWGMVSVSQADSIPAGLADPTQPSVGGGVASRNAARKPTGPVLQSTFVSSSLRRAVISGRSYLEGDKFGGGVITDIQPYEVVVKQGDRETRLRLFPKVVKENYLVKVPANSQEGGR
ncbi:MAG: hypothetical protein WD823_03800 [Sulfuricaulis sp.]|uniref:hypothetical protein n=1 Tax=Sulfuricaulis sp. TaxID=2003553 RepID=UPI0034A159AF